MEVNDSLGQQGLDWAERKKWLKSKVKGNVFSWGSRSGEELQIEGLNMREFYVSCSFSFFWTEIRKVLSKISKEKGCEVLGEWIKPCEKHLHWSATSTFSGNGRVIWAKFKSFLSHVVNKHAGLDDVLFNKCAHGVIEPRKWLKVGMFCTQLCIAYVYMTVFWKTIWF